MEVTGVVLRQSPPLCFSSKELLQSSSSVFPVRKRAVRFAAFSDRRHVDYYGSGIRCEVKEKEKTVTMVDNNNNNKGGLKKLKKQKKQQLKLLKGLSRDLSTFTQIGFGLDSTDPNLVDCVNGTAISNAAELLLERLQKLKNEEKELKMKRKEDKARLKAERMQNRLVAGGQMSSSSSSESSSSDSECGEVVDMNSLKRTQTNQNSAQPIIVETISQSSSSVMPALPPLESHVSEVQISPVLASSSVAEETRPFVNLENRCCSGNEASCASLANACNESSVLTTPTKKVEVCMGGKCKKSGAGALLEEFQKAVGMDVAVSGCKCMGKCRDGPNVRVMSSGVDGGVVDNSVKSPSNPLCIGVGLEDVDVIVANFLGENQRQLGLAV